MWSIDYVQVPREEKEMPTKETKSNEKQTEHVIKPTPIHNRLVKQINVSNDSSGSLIKSGSESSLSEDCSIRRNSIDRQRSGEKSSKEWRNEQQEEKETCSDNEEKIPQVPVRRRRSRVHGGFRKSEGIFFINFIFLIQLLLFCLKCITHLFYSCRK